MLQALCDGAKDNSNAARPLKLRHSVYPFDATGFSFDFIPGASEINPLAVEVIRLVGGAKTGCVRKGTRMYEEYMKYEECV